MKTPTAPKIAVIEEFKAFLLKHSVVGLAVGVVIGGAVGKVVKALVDDIIMPVVGVLTPSGDWRAITLNVWRLKFGIGDFVGNLLDFSIVAFVVFLIIKTFLKEAPKAAGPAMKTCPQCLESIVAEARKCKFCASEVSK